ncbi:hypothetical protein KBY55_34950 [Streptomyces sp. b94]|uniref:hypothetical protein n=1 Tax=Streptomyces sp. b94 TaxID=1827634 RepID=UPI001B382AD3|nr:hypothetical protein [Streptomyces sp. b94]MBQ1101114.1 hypothetical protein [Streptomyces sp. b94]
MLSRPGGLLFWIVFVSLLFLIAIAPVQTAQAVIAVLDGIAAFFTGLKTFVEVLSSSTH